jgi:hypothetical protein
MPFNPEARAALTGLAEGLLPLQEWVRSAAHVYVPPNAKDLPWRAGESLTHERLQTIAYVEWLVAASDADDLLLARWDHIRQDPLAYCPLPSPRAFREGRGLSQAPRFATVEAGNALADASGRQMSRRQLYDQCTPILKATVNDAQKRLGPVTPPPSGFWTTLAQELHRGNCPEWRGVAGAPQSTLLTEQLLRDVLTALLNGWLEVPPPWRYAVLIELGEFRRPGNAYKRSDVEAARESFKDALGRRAVSPDVLAPEAPSEDVRHVTQWKSIP